MLVISIGSCDKVHKFLSDLWSELCSLTLSRTMLSKIGALAKLAFKGSQAASEQQYKKWIEGQPQQLEQFRMIVLEEQLVEKLKNALKSKKKVIKFSELANK